MGEYKVSYEQIKKANEEINTTDIKGKEYASVNERIKAYRKVYPTGKIHTSIEEIKEDYIRIKAIISDEQDRVIATGTASEKLTGDKSKDYINVSSMVENCETSAVGRALGFCGFGVDIAVASAEDMNKVENKGAYEIAKGIFIPLEDAIKQVKLTINELYKKMGMRKEDLDSFLLDKIWLHLQEMNIYQLLKLEDELKTANMENSEYHKLYNLNTKAKEVIPINQEVQYKSSYRRFGEIALKMCGTDELKRQEVIDEYAEMEIDLGVSYE